MTLRLVEVRTFDSLYRDSRGLLVTRPHGAFHKYDLVEDAEAILDHFWAQWRATQNRYNLTAFVESLRPRLVEDWQADEIGWCDYNDHPIFLYDGDYLRLGNGSPVCDSHRDHYWMCEDCDEWYSETTTVGGREVCEGCLDYSYNYCEECDEYVHHDEDHSHECDCESHKINFEFPNGDSTVRQDQRVTVSMPAGVISDEGMAQIARKIVEITHSMPFDTAEEREERRKIAMLSYDLDKIGNDWQRRDGNFTKRLSRHAHKSGVKLPAELISEIGNVARAQSNGVDVAVEVTRDLNLPAEEFYHDDSCWWQSYSESRCALKTNGGIGLRSFDSYGSVSGRAWIMPLKRDTFGNLTPTYDATGAAAYVVFNGYGALQGYTAARVTAQMVGGSYTKISFTCSPMYVNGESGYLVGPADVVEAHVDGSLYLDVSTHSDLGYREETAALVSA